MLSHRQTSRDLKAFGRWFVTGHDPDLPAVYQKPQLRLAPPPTPGVVERRSRAERAVETHWPVRVDAAKTLAAGEHRR